MHEPGVGLGIRPRPGSKIVLTVKSEIDPRLLRHSRQAIAALRSAESPTDLEALRNRLDQLEDRTDGLRERLEHLEREKGGPLR